MVAVRERKAQRIIWEPNPGSQEAFLECPVYEVLLEGTRGGGKTDVLLMDFLQFVGQGYGRAWRGVLFRQSYPALEEVIERTFEYIPLIFPRAKYNGGKHCWRFPDGEVLYLRFALRASDYETKLHGHQYPWIGWEELTNWPDDELYMTVMSVCRSKHPGVPRRYRATTNPHGVGHNWVKARFIDPAPRGVVVVDQEGRERVAIHSTLDECPQLAINDPNYVKNLRALDGPRREAWLHGNWDIVAGGMFDDVWDPTVHVVEPFDIPHTWHINRSFDWGSSAPYSVGWWAESDGAAIRYPNGHVFQTRKGDLFRVKELYGWTGKPNEGTRELAVEVARKVKEIDERFPIKVRPGPADPSIYTKVNNNCIGEDMAREGITWERAEAEGGSRINGWEIMRKLLKGAKDPRLGLPGLYIFDSCRQFIRTIPPLPRDAKDMDDVDTSVEDHVADEARYRCLAKKNLFRAD